MVRAVAFLRSVGIPVACGPAPAGCFFPGVWFADGGMACDPRVAYVGDMLHEAGHLAILPARMRELLGVGSVYDGEAQAERWRIHDEVGQAADADEDHDMYWLLRSTADEELAADAWSYAAAVAARIEPWRVFDVVPFFKVGHEGPVPGAGRMIIDMLAGQGRRPGVLGLAENGMTSMKAFPKMSRWLA